MSKKRDYRIYEGLRVALPLTFISGFLNAFTFVTQGKRFAGVQSGNVISLAYHLALDHYDEALQFLVPIVFFSFGQGFTYLARKWFKKRQFQWHFSSSLLMTVLTLITAILAPIVPSFVTNALVAFVASIQVETFKRIRKMQYASVMMTGNVKNAARLSFVGLFEKNQSLKQEGRHVYFILLSFGLGVYISTKLSYLMGEYTLWVVLIPLLLVNYLLWIEKRAEETS